MYHALEADQPIPLRKCPQALLFMPSTEMAFATRLLLTRSQWIRLPQHRAILPLEQAIKNCMFPSVPGAQPRASSRVQRLLKLIEDAGIFSDVPYN